MKVLVMHGSKRKNGNTGLLASDFIRGAEEAGHQVERVELGGQKYVECFNMHGGEKLSCKVARRINVETAALCQKYPDKFGFVAALPFHAIDGQRDFKNMLDLKFTSSVKVEITGYYRAGRRVA